MICIASKACALSAVTCIPVPPTLPINPQSSLNHCTIMSDTASHHKNPFDCSSKLVHVDQYISIQLDRVCSNGPPTRECSSGDKHCDASGWGEHAFTRTTGGQWAECQCHPPVPFDGATVFRQLIKDNLWTNTCCTLALSSASEPCTLGLAGVIHPSTLLLSGSEHVLELICSLWSRRLLKSPPGFHIQFVGECVQQQVYSVKPKASTLLH